jgi:type I restriction enzyme, S subunit
MSEWKEFRLLDLASKETNSFIDGDWIEAPHIKDNGIRLIQTGNIGRGFFRDNNRKYISEESFQRLNCKEVRTGDILICRLADPIGRSCIIPNLKTKNITSVDVTIFRVDKSRFNEEFVLQLINTDEFLNKANEVAGGSTRQRISRSNLANLKIFIPLSIFEQQRIAQIFSTTDAVIEKTQAAIAKYKAIKQGMLHDLFTRGIDISTGKLRPKYEDAPDLYKESKLGMVPKEWEEKIFDDLIKTIDSGWSPNCLVEPANIDEWGSLKTTSVTWDGYNPNENKKLPLGIIPRIDTEVDIDDILITRVGPRERVGVVVHVNDGRKKLMVSDNMLRFKMKTDENLFLPFLALLLGSQYVQREWQKRIAGLAEAQVVINQQIIKKTAIILASYKEQKALHVRLDNISAKIQSEKNYLLKLQRIKAGLMADLLSGRKRIHIETTPDKDTDATRNNVIN